MLSAAARFISVAFEAGQPDVIADVAFGCVQAVNAKVLGILGLIGPEQLNVTCGTVVVLGLLKSQDVVDFQVEHEPFGLVLTLVSQLFYDGLAERWLIKLCVAQPQNPPLVDRLPFRADACAAPVRLQDKPGQTTGGSRL